MTDATHKKNQTGAVDGVDRTLATMRLEDRVQQVKGVSARRAKALDALGIKSVGDLLTHFPRRYIDLSQTESIASAKIGQSCTICGDIYKLTLKRPKPHLPLVEITLVDATGTLLITAFRQPWLMDTLREGMRVTVAGKVEFDYGFKRMTNPFIEEVSGADSDGVGMVIPVHPACADISTAWMRRLIMNALEQTRGLQDCLPLELRTRYKLMSRAHALQSIHFPQDMAEARQARRRLAYEEVLLLELALMQEGFERSVGRRAERHCVDGRAIDALWAELPFALTQGQLAAVSDVLDALASPTCANHMLLGDVGTGKTIVAAFALAAAADSGTQAAMMAPTEVLAVQYATALGDLLDRVGVTWALLTGSTSASERARIIEGVRSGELSVLFGTHAILEDDVLFAHCSLCIIDEQQRFGVAQRAKLLEKGEAPDALYLTATPIPRSLALAVFGNLTLSYLKERPNKGAARTTKVLLREDSAVAYDAALAAVERGEQAFVVCPLVGLDTQERDKRAGVAAQEKDDEYAFEGIAIEQDTDFSNDNVQAAEAVAKRLQETTFFHHTVGLLHGKLSSFEKQSVMEEFRAGKIDVLVATTVIEVGVDVPNATVMVVEDADRFGLSQLHQLRGRVGRGEKSAQIFLISNSQNETAVERLAAMERTEDGFELAQYDLSLRHEGDLLGNRQHGASSLKLVNVVRDGKLIEAAHDDARALLEEDPELKFEGHRALAREVRALRGSAAIIGG